jgi:hypothetical protein
MVVQDACIFSDTSDAQEEDCIDLDTLQHAGIPQHSFTNI